VRRSASRRCRRVTSATAAQLVTSAASRTGASNARSAPAQVEHRHGRHCVRVELHDEDINGPDGNRRGEVFHDIRKGDDLDLCQGRYKGPSSLCSVRSTHDHHGYAVLCATSRRQHDLGSKVVPFTKVRRPRQGRSEDPANWSAGWGHRQRDNSEQAIELRWSPTRGPSRPSRETEQRRVQRSTTSASIGRTTSSRALASRSSAPYSPVQTPWLQAQRSKSRPLRPWTVGDGPAVRAHTTIDGPCRVVRQMPPAVPACGAAVESNQ